MTMATVDSIWKDRIDRALKYVCRAIDLKQRADIVHVLNKISDQYINLQRPHIISEVKIRDSKSSLYKMCSFDEITGNELMCSLIILPQIDHLPSMFTYVALQRNFLCDTVTNLSDLLLNESDEDVKNLLISIQSDSLTEQQQTIRSVSTTKRVRHSPKSIFVNDKNNEFIFDEEHLIELLKRLKQQFILPSLTADDENDLFETLIKLYPTSSDLIRDRFGTIFESKRSLTKEFTPNIDNASLAIETDVQDTLHSYFMLFCRRCHLYDCFLHKDRPVTPEINKPLKTSNVIYRPCDKKCYRRQTIDACNQQCTKIELKRCYSDFIDNNKMKSSTNSTLSKRSKSSLIKCEQISSLINGKFCDNGFLIKSSIKQKQKDEISDWLSSDKTLFRIFYTIFGDNICMIANLLDKSCLQVHSYYLNYIERNNELKSRQNDDLNENDVKMTNGHDDHEPETTSTNRSKTSRRSHSLSLRRQRSHQHVLLNHYNSLLLEQKRHTYYPCDHDRSIPCNENCYCIRSGNFCEKYCCCSSTKCDNRFPGCRCRSSCTTKQCPCYAAARECDPDLCTQCGADDFRNGNPNSNELITKSSCSCHNVAIQRSLHKPLLLAESDVAGWGIFTEVNIQRNEFIAEYCGEILTQDEGELRGRMYDTIGTSFLFDLNEEFMVDATRRGNKIRFANHSISPNCYAKVIMVNGDHRIGIYSKRFIFAGEELFFDYRYGANHHLRFVGVEKQTNDDQTDTYLL